MLKLLIPYVYFFIACNKYISPIHYLQLKWGRQDVFLSRLCWGGGWGTVMVVGLSCGELQTTGFFPAGLLSSRDSLINITLTPLHTNMCTNPQVVIHQKSHLRGTSSQVFAHLCTQEIIRAWRTPVRMLQICAYVHEKSYQHQAKQRKKKSV